MIRWLVSFLLAGVAFGAPQWIWVQGEEAAPKNRFTYFRKVVELKTVPADATVLFAADSTAHLWINGRPLRRKVARYHEDRITAEVVDAAGALRPGRNVIVVLHHNWGPIVTFQRSANKHAGLWIGGPWLASDTTWKARVAPEFQQHDKQILGLNSGHDRRIRYPVIVDGGKLPGNLHSPLFDDAAWANAVAVTDGPWPAEPKAVDTPGQKEAAMRPSAVLAAGRLVPAQPLSADPLSIAAGIRTARYEPDGALPPVIRGKAGESRYVTWDFQEPVHGYPYLELKNAPAGVTVDFGYGEIAYSQYSGQAHVDAKGRVNPESVVGTGYADRYITRDGAQKIELPDERTARWLSLQFHFKTDGEVQLGDVGIVRSQYPVTNAGNFFCGDKRVDQIVELCKIHTKITMSDGYVDTPGREDGQWIEDARVRAIIGSRWFGDEKLRRQVMRHYVESTRGDGAFHAFPPSNYPAYPVGYDWAVQWSAMLYDDYYWTGKTDLINEYWNVLTAFWKNALAHVDENGIWRTNRVFADIRIGVHPKGPKQSSGVVTPFMIERLRWSVEMARAAGHKEQAEQWSATADRMAAAFRKHHWLPAAGAVPAHAGDRLDPEDAAATRGFSQAAQVNTVLAGLVSHDEARQVLEYVFPGPEGTPPEGVARWNNPTFVYRSLRALSDHGMTERAVAHMLERYAPYLPGDARNRLDPQLQGPKGGPLPEYWINREDLKLKDGELDTAQPQDETGSHGWAGVTLLWLHETLLGVRITEPGGGKLRIAPETGGFAYVSGRTRTPKGNVLVDFRPALERLAVKVPEGVEAEVILPAAWKGRAVHVPKGATEAGEGRYVVSKGGSYLFTLSHS